MKTLVGLVMALCVLSGGASAQTTQADISARLMGKPLQMRGFWKEDSLKFDASGVPLKAYKTDSFTESGFNAQKVELNGNRLEIEGDRVGLIFNEDEMTEDGGALFDRVTIHKNGKKAEKVKIEIEAGPGTDFTKALNAIFATSLAELVPDIPPYWQEFFHADILHEITPASIRKNVKIPTNSRTVQQPRLLKTVDPSFSETARELKFSGTMLASLIVDDQGMPEDVQVQRPAGLGLDEQAVKAVKQYRFKPATRNGQPVQVKLSVEVNFQIF